MGKDQKVEADKGLTFDKLEVRVGRIVDTEKIAIKRGGKPELPHYKMTIDFGKFGRRTSVGRFTLHDEGEVKNLLVIAVLNFPPHRMGEHESEVLVLGAQFPKSESGEATFLTPLNRSAKIGGKIF